MMIMRMEIAIMMTTFTNNDSSNYRYNRDDDNEDGNNIMTTTFTDNDSSNYRYNRDDDNEDGNSNNDDDVY